METTIVSIRVTRLIAKVQEKICPVVMESSSALEIKSACQKVCTVMGKRIARMEATRLDVVSG